MLHGVFLDLSISYLKMELSQGFLSPIIFTMCINKLLVILTTSGIWCHIGSAYIGALSYADDITLLCPVIRGINVIIVLCCEYAKEYNVTFNQKKTVCIKFGSKITIDEHVSPNGFLCNGQIL